MNDARIGPYRVLSRMAEGVTSEIVLCERDGHRVVAKRLLSRWRGHALCEARLQREARVLLSVRHPNVVSAMEVVDGALVMEHLSGAPLDSRPRGAVELLRLVRQACLGLDAIHRAGYVHADVSLANLFVTESGYLRVIDLGLAEPIGGAFPPELSGTFSTMSPERVRGAPASPRMDVYSLGVVLFELLHGVPAFEGESVPEILAAIERGVPRLACGDEALATAVHRATCREPCDRFESMADFARALGV